MYKYFFKRVLDFVVVLCVLLVIWPILLVIAIWLHFANKGAGAFFTQERPGKNGKIFKVIKFKSMTDEQDTEGMLLPDKMRLTKVGAFIRKTSIDELPQLLNVLKGDMAFIGPRPLLPEYLPYYTRREQLRHSLRPGITGWAQANGRNLLSWDEKLAMDVWYVEHLSFVLDIKIFLLTIKNVLRRKGCVVVPRPVYLNKERMLNKKHLFDSCKIRLLETGDLSKRVEWMKDPKVYKTMDLNPFITLETTIAWFNKNRDNKERVDCAVEKDGDIVAFTGITGIKDGTGETYSFVDPGNQGKGLGTIARYYTCKYGFEQLKLKKMISYCNVDNVASIKVNDKLGYKFIKYIECKDITGKPITRKYYELVQDEFAKHD